MLRNWNRICRNGRWLYIVVFWNEKAATKKMSHMVALCESSSNVPRGCLAVAVDAFGANDSIEGLKGFSREEDGWAETANMKRKVKQDMKLGFVEPLAGPASSSKKETFNFSFQNTLLNHKKKHYAENRGKRSLAREITHNVLIDVLNCGLPNQRYQL